MKKHTRIIWVVAGIFFSQTPSFAKELAKVNESVITDRDLSLSLGALNEGQKSALLKDINSRRQILFDIIDREVVAQEAEKLKLDQEPEFKEAMALTRKQLLMGRLLEKKLASKMTLPELKKYYQNHKNKFSADIIHVQHILLPDELGARKLLELAKDSQNDFQDLAEKYSKDPSAKHNRGDLGFVGRDRFVPAFSDAAFAANRDEIVGPVKTIYGYHIIKVVDKKLGKLLEFDEVELQVRNSLRQELIRDYVDSLKAQYKIKVDNVALEKMR